MANPNGNTRKKWCGFFRFQEGRDSPNETRNVLLLVAALIATVTFQACINPPGGVWQDDGNGQHKAGQAVYGSDKRAFTVFLISNTLALSTSILIIVSMTIDFPFRFEIAVATVSMVVSYGSAVFAVTPNLSAQFRYVLFAASLPFIIRCLIEFFKSFRT